MELCNNEISKDIDKEQLKSLTRKALQSPNWEKYSKGEINLNKDESYKEGFPKYVFRNYDFIKFMLILANGEIIKNATVDMSRQYYAEGIQWNDSKGRVIYDHWVAAWKEMESEDNNNSSER